MLHVIFTLAGYHYLSCMAGFSDFVSLVLVFLHQLVVTVEPCLSLPLVIQLMSLTWVCLVMASLLVRDLLWEGCASFHHSTLRMYDLNLS